MGQVARIDAQVLHEEAQKLPAGFVKGSSGFVAGDRCTGIAKRKLEEQVLTKNTAGVCLNVSLVRQVRGF